MEESGVDESVPDYLLCPITQELFADPCVAEDGVTYERAAIETWFREHCTSPCHGHSLRSKAVIPNLAIRSAVDAYKNKHKNNNSNHGNNSNGSNSNGSNGSGKAISACIAAVETMSLSPPPPLSLCRRERAFELIQERFHREHWGSVQQQELRAFNLPGSEEFFVAIDSAPGDRYGYGDKAARENARLSCLGWGNKAVVANIEAGAAFVTTMGFHRYYWDLNHKNALGLPTSDEYAFKGGSRQDFAKGYTLWKPAQGCYHVPRASIT